MPPSSRSRHIEILRFNECTTDCSDTRYPFKTYLSPLLMQGAWPGSTCPSRQLLQHCAAESPPHRSRLIAYVLLPELPTSISERCPIVDMLLSLTQQCAHDLALGNGGTSHALDAATGDTRTSASAIGLALDARQCYPGHGSNSKIGKSNFSVTSVQIPQYTHVIVAWHMSPPLFEAGLSVCSLKSRQAILRCIAVPR